MKKISIRNLIIVLLCITIIFMAIGYSVLSLRITRLKNKKESFNVVFTNVEEYTSVKGGSSTPTCKHHLKDQQHTLSMDFTLNNPQDELAYNITIENRGTIEAKIIDVKSYLNDTTSQSFINSVKITKTDLSDKVLSPGEKTTLKVVATYLEGNDSGTKVVPYNLSVIASSKDE